MVPCATRTEYDEARRVAVLRRLRCSGTLRAVVNLAGGCAQHDTTGQFPVADRLASAIEQKVQELARPFGPSAKQDFAEWTPACRSAGAFAFNLYRG
jgi:hypothetical protein